MFGVDELGLDLGTSTLHMVVRGKGIVLSEPAYVAYDRQTRNVVAVGEEARRMYGRTPAGLIVERPLRDGRLEILTGLKLHEREVHARALHQVLGAAVAKAIFFIFFVYDIHSCFLPSRLYRF